jgi:hypothetical protein
MLNIVGADVGYGVLIGPHQSGCRNQVLFPDNRRITARCVLVWPLEN